MGLLSFACQAVDGRAPGVVGDALPASPPGSPGSTPPGNALDSSPGLGSDGGAPLESAVMGDAGVAPSVATQIAFEGLATTGMESLPLDLFTVSFRDDAGQVVESAVGEVTLELVGSGSARLIGDPRARAFNGVARFYPIGIDAPGDNLILAASSPGFARILSAPIRVTAPAFVRLATSISGQPVWSLAQVTSPAPALYASSEAGVFRSANFRSDAGDITWVDASFGLGVQRGPLLTPVNDPGVVYAARGNEPRTSFGFTFAGKSVDGRSWRDLPAPGVTGPMRALAVDPRDPALVFAGGPPGIYRSADAGQTWSLAGLEGRDTHALAIEASPPFDSYAVTVTQAGIGTLWRSSDQGANWSDVLTLEDTSFSSLVLSGSALFVATTSGLRRSLDRGATWLNDGVATEHVSVAASAPTRVYASDQASLRVSSNGGATFGAPIDLGLGPLHALLADAEEPLRVYLGTDTGVFVSSDGGATWRDGSALAGLGLQRQETVALHPDAPSTVLVGGRAGLFRSIDSGESWVATAPLSNDSSSAIFGLAFHPDDPQLAYACDLGGGLYRSLDAGQTWGSRADVGAGPYCYEVVIAGSNLWVPTVGGVRRSRDGGDSWEATGLTISTYALTVAPDGLTLYASTNEGTHRSTDGGETFAPLVGSGASNAMVLDQGAPLALYVGHRCGVADSEIGGVKRSLDSGLTWSILSGTPCNAADLEVGDDGTLFLLGNFGFSVGRDGGSDWVRGGSGLFATGHKMVVAPGGQTIFIASDVGVYRSRSGGL